MASLTDREIIVACFNAICTLAQRLTGERLVIRLKSPNGGFSEVYADEFSAFFAVPKAGSEVPLVPGATKHPKQDDRVSQILEMH
jgi:hypothetical protein